MLQRWGLLFLLIATVSAHPNPHISLPSEAIKKPDVVPDSESNVIPESPETPVVPVVEKPFAGTSPGFIKASEHLKESLNKSVDPCTDFYEFSCGNWIANNPIPNDLSSYGHFQKLRESVQKQMKDLYESPKESGSRSINNLKRIYKACMDEDKINGIGAGEMLEAIKGLGYWPMVHNELWKQKHFDLTTLMINIAVSRGVDVFLENYASTDTKNVSRRLLQFDQGSLGLGGSTRDYYMDQKKYAKQMKAYKTYIIAKTRQLTLDSGLPVNETKIEADVDELIAFETQFAEITVPDDERRNYTALYNIKKFSELKELMPLIEWNRYTRAVMPYATHEYLNTDPDIIISEIDYLRRLTELLRSTNPRIVTNYIILRYTSAWSMQIGTKYEDISQDFALAMYGRKEKSPRWKDCVSITNGKMMYASGAMYVRKHFNEDSKKTTLDMIGDLRESFKLMVHANDWMDKLTREYALEKANGQLSLIGYPDFILKDEKLDEWYKDMDLDDKTSFSQMVDSTIKWSISFSYKRLLEKVDRSEFSSNAATVNAFYSSIKNAIIFPAAILQAPFFDHGYPKALNYGGIGAVIGHEITHGFDDQGRQFDESGNLREWWDPTTREKFTERAQCMIDQYGEVEVPNTNLKINGKLTQGENIADNGGVKQAFKAYKRYLEKNGAELRVPGLEEYTNEQMFYIGYAQTWCGHMTTESSIRQILSDPHSPGKYRVNVVLSNQPEFAETFSCPKNSPMNPPKRCAVW